MRINLVWLLMAALAWPAAGVAWGCTKATAREKQSCCASESASASARGECRSIRLPGTPEDLPRCCVPVIQTLPQIDRPRSSQNESQPDDASVLSVGQPWLVEFADLAAIVGTMDRPRGPARTLLSLACMLTL